MDIERSTKAGGALFLNYDSLPYTENAAKGTRKFFERPTATTENYEMHITYLKQKGPSHAPHQHVDTEIILMIDGESEMTIDGKQYAAGPGDLYIMESGKMHGIVNTSDKPCSYYAFKWR
jgi:(S)-ureidoglycine aminohydrolase